MRTFKVVAVPFSAKGRPCGQFVSSGRRYPDQLVAEVRAAWRPGVLGYGRLAVQFSVPKGTIKSWIKGCRRATPTMRFITKRVYDDAR